MRRIGLFLATLGCCGVLVGVLGVSGVMKVVSPAELCAELGVEVGRYEDAVATVDRGPRVGARMLPIGAGALLLSIMFRSVAEWRERGGVG
jgi:predicted metal-binding membrane protein